MAEWMIEEETFPQEMPKTERELVPEGEHGFEIKSATEGPHKFKEGEFLMLRLSALNGSYSFVFCDIEKSAKGARLASSLSAALGGPAAGRLSLVAEELEGREVRARVYHQVGKNGRTYVNVGEFLPAKTAAAKPATAKKVDRAAAVAAPDDIPF
jgi:hypothetical protein